MKFEINRQPNPEYVVSKPNTDTLIENLQLRIGSLEMNLLDTIAIRSSHQESRAELEVTVTNLKAQITSQSISADFNQAKNERK